MRFKNLKTGNIVSSENKETIALMQKSPNYEEVKVAAAKVAESGDGKDKK
jgi:hypothetical protein